MQYQAWIEARVDVLSVDQISSIRSTLKAHGFIAAGGFDPSPTKLPGLFRSGVSFQTTETMADKLREALTPLSVSLKIELERVDRSEVIEIVPPLHLVPHSSSGATDTAAAKEPSRWTVTREPVLTPTLPDSGKRMAELCAQKLARLRPRQLPSV